MSPAHSGVRFEVFLQLMVYFILFFQVYLRFQRASVAKSCEKIEVVQIGRNSQVLEL